MRLIPPFRSHPALRSAGRRSRRPGPRLEELELRNLLSAAPVAADFHETLDHALDLAVLDPGGPLSESGTIGSGPDAAADVNYYQFTLTQPARVQLGAQNAGAAGNSAFVL